MPIPDHVREAYLEIRQTGSNEIVTVLAFLSPSNKRPGEGGRQYEQKRLMLFGSLTNLVEIDLLRAGGLCPCEGMDAAAITGFWSAERASYDPRIDYRRDASPPLVGEDATWADALLRQTDLRGQ